MRYTPIRTSTIRSAILCCALFGLVSAGARDAWAIAYARVDIDINSVLVAGVSGTTITGIGTGQVLDASNDTLFQTPFWSVTDSTFASGYGAAPRAFVGNPSGNQAEDAIFVNTNPHVDNYNFARADNLFHVTVGTNTLISGGVNMDAVAETSIGEASAFTDMADGLSSMLWSLGDFPTTDSNAGTRDINVSFSWTRRAEALIDLGYNPPSKATVDVLASISFFEIRSVAGSDLLSFKGVAPPAAYGALIINPAPQFPGGPGIDIVDAGVFSHTFSFAPGGPGTATGRYAIFASFTLNANVVLHIPEPSGLLLTSLGMVGLIVRARRRRRAERA